MRKKVMWSKIAQCLRDQGYNFTPDQVAGRWKTITRAYKNTKDHNNKSGNSRKTYEYDTELDELMGDCPTVNPPHLQSSRKSASQTIESEECSDTDVESQSPREKKPRKSNSSEILEFLRLHAAQQKERQKEEGARKEKMHADKLSLLSNLVSAINKSKPDN
ncbi:uncharacterized protein LOC117338967 [Pecten maximus]|uniref:uncharacterized protein LOC117338967 n=1 Tax=Pecten maximus TaxID=6579 RepID=UPI001458A78F|nr:uncharacterized protein LOC117338967 [Pecten maximus]